MKEIFYNGPAVLALRLNKGWTQRQAAAAAGVGRSTQQRYEAGTEAVNLSILQKIGKPYGVVFKIKADWRTEE